MTDQQQAATCATTRWRPARQTGLGAPVRSTSPASRQNSLWSDAWASLKRNPLFWIGSVLGVFFVLDGARAAAVLPRAPTRATATWPTPKAPPSAEHWFGFDQQGCDYLANVVYGARNSLIDRAARRLGVLVLGILIGAIAGYYGGFTDSLLARITDIFFALPLVLGALILLRVGPVDRACPIISDRGPGAVAIALALFGWMTAMRLVRSQVIAVKSTRLRGRGPGHGRLEPAHPDPAHPARTRSRRCSSTRPSPSAC